MSNENQEIVEAAKLWLASTPMGVTPESVAWALSMHAAMLAVSPEGRLFAQWKTTLEGISEFGDARLSDEGRARVQNDPERALRLAVRMTKQEAVEKIEALLTETPSSRPLLRMP